jgi:DNA-binding NarL/FixJ family response regulator
MGGTDPGRTGELPGEDVRRSSAPVLGDTGGVDGGPDAHETGVGGEPGAESGADPGAESGAVLEARARACHAAGDHRGALDAYEAAFARFRAAGDLAAAARAARTVGWFRGWVFGEWAVYQGWSGRALTLLEHVADDSAAGWRVCEQARMGNDLDAQRGQYLEAIELARRAGDEDLECEAMASLGIMLAFSGFVDEGMRHLDRALAAICGGGVQELPVLEGCLCGLLHACERTHDVDRAQQWLRAAEPVIRRGNLVSVAGHCRAHYAGILVSAGQWDAAEAELRRAVELLHDRAGLRDSALCRLADLRLRQGRLEDAAALLARLEDHEDAAVPLARLRLAQGRPALAIELVDRALVGDGRPDHVEAPLLAVAVEAHLQLGDVDTAVSLSERLSALATAQPTAAVHGLAAAARARVCVATGGDARACWREARVQHAAAKMPLEAATARLELARLCAADRPEVAIAEATAAGTAFEEIGARRAADEAAALLRDLGAPARTGPKRRTPLTRREEEVLALLGHGLTNGEIGQRLAISAKTVEHHVGRVLAKLGVRSRAEAAAVAARAEVRGAL